jgi:hypothetical protein
VYFIVERVTYFFFLLATITRAPGKVSASPLYTRFPYTGLPLLLLLLQII